MTTAQLDSARMLIPGAYEWTDPQHRDRDADAAPRVLTEDLRRRAAPYVLSAPQRPTTWLAQSAEVFTDLALATGIVFATALAPVLAMTAIAMVVRLIVRAGVSLAERL